VLEQQLTQSCTLWHMWLTGTLLAYVLPAAQACELQQQPTSKQNTVWTPYQAMLPARDLAWLTYCRICSLTCPPPRGTKALRQHHTASPQASYMHKLLEWQPQGCGPRALYLWPLQQQQREKQ
jgi:hypothetical protein